MQEKKELLNNSPSKKKAHHLLSQSFSHSVQQNCNQFKSKSNIPTKYRQNLIQFTQPILSIYFGSLQSTKAQQDEQQKEQKKKIRSQIFDLNHQSQLNNKSTPLTIAYLIFRTHLQYFPICSPEFKTSIKIDTMKQQDVINSPTLITMYKNQQIIVANGCYIYWINLLKKESQWKYVQRKQIYAIQVIQQMGLLAVGGKNFSKLSYFGKQTSRSNIKIYNCGKLQQRNHLFTYDFPDNDQVGNVIELKYITTAPSGAKLLIAYTNHNDQIHKLYFFRIRAFNLIQIYGKVELNQIGIQSIVSMKYNQRSLKLMVLQQVSEDHSALKRLKVKSMYQKAQVLTQSIKMQFGIYQSIQIGGSKQKQWYSLINKGGNTASIYRSYRFHNNPQTFKDQKHQMDSVFDINDGNQILVKGYDFVKIKRKIKQTQQSHQ